MVIKGSSSGIMSKEIQALLKGKSTWVPWTLNRSEPTCITTAKKIQRNK